MDTAPKSPDSPEPETTDGKKVYDVLQVSDTRYRNLFETAQDEILIPDAKTGLIVDIHRFLIDMRGFSYKPFPGKKIGGTGFFRDIVANKDTLEELQRQRVSMLTYQLNGTEVIDRTGGVRSSRLRSPDQRNIIHQRESRNDRHYSGRRG
jgi:hypothetical protein